MPVIQVEDLARTFTSLKKDPGLRGTVRSLFTRQTVSVQAVKVAGAVLARLPVADIAIDEVEAEEIIRQIFIEGVQPGSGRKTDATA